MIAVDRPERLTELAAALTEQGHEVVIHTRRVSRGKRRTTLSPGVVVDHLPAGPDRPLDDAELHPHLAGFGRRLADRWTRRPPDVLHAHGWQSGLAALSAATRIPLVQGHGPLALHDPDRRTQARLEAALSRTAEASTVGCRQDEDDLVGFGVPRSRVRVIPWGVDLTEFTMRGPSSPSCECPRLLVLTGPGPGADLAVRALPRIPGVQLVVAGGPQPERLETDPAAGRLGLLAKEEAVDDRLLVLGHVPESQAPRLIRSADLLLSLEDDDPHAVDVLRAMACGVPAVATPSGGHRDVVLHDVTGIVLPDATPHTLAARVRGLLLDGTHRLALGLAAEDRARSRHSWARVAAETHDLYQRITAPDS